MPAANGYDTASYSRRMDFGKMNERKLSVLKRIGELLDEKKISWALGGSAMLYLRGLAADFQDLDIMVTEEDAVSARELLRTYGGSLQESTRGSYASTHFYELVIEGVEIDIIGGFRILVKDQIMDCKLNVADIRDAYELDGVRIPLDTLQNWRRYYALMGRDGRASMIEQALRGGDSKSKEQ